MQVKLHGIWVFSGVEADVIEWARRQVVHVCGPNFIPLSYSICHTLQDNVLNNDKQRL